MIWLHKIIKSKAILGSILLISIVLGPGVSYGGVYFFHLALAFIILAISLNADWRLNLFRISRQAINLPLILALFWLMISMIWAEHKSYAISNIAQFTLGILIVLLCQVLIDSKQTFHFLKNKILLPLFIIVIAIAMLESFTDFRWPISSASHINDWFGRENVILENLKTERIPGYLYSSPTVFSFNANHFAVFICFFIPFLMKNKWKNYLLFVLAIIVIIQTGSRLTMMSLAVVLIVSSVINHQNFKFLGLFVATLFIPMIFFGSSLLAIKANEPVEKITGVHVLSKICIVCPEKFYLPDNEENSQSVRRQLYKQGIQYIKDSKLIGIGAGNAEWYNLKQKENTNGVTSVHFYWLELLINGGIILGIIITFYFLKVVLELWKSKQNEVTTHFIMALMLFGMAVISMSSAHYFLPFYAFLGLLSAWINLNNRDDEKNTFAG
jgi:O-antigen ligase